MLQSATNLENAGHGMPSQRCMRPQYKNQGANLADAADVPDSEAEVAVDNSDKGLTGGHRDAAGVRVLVARSGRNGSGEVLWIRVHARARQRSAEGERACRKEEHTAAAASHDDKGGAHT